MSAHPFKAIAAMSLNRVIGRGKTIPWHLPEDFKWFKETTMGHVLAMGRRTYESIGRPLPGRETVVLTRNPGSVTDVRTLDSREALGQAVRLIVCDQPNPKATTPADLPFIESLLAE